MNSRTETSPTGSLRSRALTWLVLPLVTASVCSACAGEPKAVRWTLDENPPSVDVAELRLLGFEQDCASGRSADDRISYELSETIEEVEITIKIAPLGGSQDCPGNPPTLIVVPLDEPLGERRLIDGATGSPVRVQDR